mgnify:CR=1 FL=1
MVWIVKCRWVWLAGYSISTNHLHQINASFMEALASPAPHPARLTRETLSFDDPGYNHHVELQRIPINFWLAVFSLQILIPYFSQNDPALRWIRRRKEIRIINIVQLVKTITVERFTPWPVIPPELCCSRLQPLSSCLFCACVVSPLWW